MRYKIIDLFHSSAIRHSWINLEDYCWWLKWQYNLKYHGEQSWGYIDQEAAQKINKFHNMGVKKIINKFI